MSPSGYSGTPLAKKIGVKSGNVVCHINAPNDYKEVLSPLPENVILINGLEPKADIIHAFVHNRGELESIYPNLYSGIHKNGMIWISWPKKASGIQTDLNRDFIREYILERGLVDVKVASYNDVYSGLKFVFRTKDR